MDKKKIGEGLAGALRKASDTAKVAKITVQELAADAKQEIADKTKQKSASTKRTASQNGNKVSAAEDNAAAEINSISVKNALQIIYYLMAADGTVFHSEEEKFDAIGAELDPEFADNKASIISGCQAQLGKIIDPEDYYDVLQDGVEAAISDTQETSESIITPKLLVWNLLTVAYSDESYVFYNLLARLDTYFMPLIYKMSDIVQAEGDDYSKYNADSKKVIASCASVAVSIKSVLDTPLLTDDGLLTEASEGTATNIEGFLKNLKIPY